MEDGTSKFEELTPNAAVRGIRSDAPATVVSVRWFGSEAFKLTDTSSKQWTAEIGESQSIQEAQRP